MAMSAASTVSKAAGNPGASGKAIAGGRKKLVLLAAPLLLVAAGAGLWFGGILPPLLGMGSAASAGEHTDGTSHTAAPAHGTPAAALPAAGAHAAANPPGVVDPHGASKPGASADARGAMAVLARGGANFMELPEVVANLNVGARRATYVKLRPRLELARPEDEAAVRDAVPRLMDLFQTYLREMRPEELRGSAGTYRLREELIARANIALAPVRVVDVLLPEMLVQ
jgi:flagellar FliL protein